MVKQHKAKLEKVCFAKIKITRFMLFELKPSKKFEQRFQGGSIQALRMLA
jgi:hypothetical protein